MPAAFSRTSGPASWSMKNMSQTFPPCQLHQKVGIICAIVVVIVVVVFQFEHFASHILCACYPVIFVWPTEQQQYPAPCCLEAFGPTRPKITRTRLGENNANATAKVNIFRGSPKPRVHRFNFYIMQSLCSS